MWKKMMFYFFTGFIATALIVPLLRQAGVPGFDAVLTSVFGANSIIGSIVAVLVLIGLVATVYIYTKKNGATK